MSSQSLAELLSDIAGASICALMTLIAASVIFRYNLNSPLLATEDVTALLLALTVFCALPNVTLSRRHISVGFFLGFFRNRPRLDRIRFILIDLGVLVMTTFMGWVVLQQAIRQAYRGSESPVMEWSLWPGTSAFAFLIIVGAIVFARRVWRDRGLPVQNSDFQL